MTIEELASASGRPAGEVLAAVAAAVAAGLLDATGPVLACRVPEARAQVLQRLAPSAAPTGGVPHPAWGAGRVADWLRWTAGQVRSDAPGAAVELLQAALGMAPDDEREALAALLADALRRAGRLEEAEALCRQTIAAGGTGADRWRLHQVLVRVLQARGRMRDALDEAHRATAAVPAGRRPWFAAAAAHAEMVLGRWADADADAAAVLDAVGAGGDLAAEVTALRVRCHVAQHDGAPVRAGGLADALVDAARRLPPDDADAQALLVAGALLGDLDRHADGLALIGEGRRLALGLGRDFDVRSACAYAALVQAATGAWEAALSDLAAATDPAGALGWTVDLMLLAAELHAVRGEMAAGARLLRDAEQAVTAGAPVTNPARLDWVRAELAKSAGDRAAAAGHLARAWEASMSSGAARERRRIGPALVRIGLLLPAEVAATGIDQSAVAADLEQRAAANPGVDGLAGAAGWAAGALARDGALLLGALERLRASGRRHEAARCAADAAYVLAADDPATATSLADEALRALDALGAAGERSRVRAALRGVGLEPARAGRPPGAAGWAGLTPAEQRVAVLVADGLSNPEVGARLYIATRTVSTHVSHALRKLGLRSRTELAVYVATHRLAPPSV
ncbi:MAG TPA: LuxR C-terminal-related transcriptional regulator [Acidimicrobiales bacterium]|nr:LuxR C-terminal-related transcriptional regulator [Acidimicrobiales bacterium]